MNRLYLLSAPGDVAARDEVGLRFLEEVVRRDPEITWGELRAASQAYAANRDAGAMDGWLTNSLRAVGGALDVVTFGGASKLIDSTKKLVSDVFDKKKVKDSLKEAASGVADDALSRFIDSLPFGIGKDLKAGHAFRSLWVIGVIVIGIVLVYAWTRKGR